MKWRNGNLIQLIDTEEFIDMVIQYDTDDMPNVKDFHVEGIKITHEGVEIELSIQD